MLIKRRGTVNGQDVERGWNVHTEQDKRPKTLQNQVHGTVVDTFAITSQKLKNYCILQTIFRFWDFNESVILQTFQTVRRPWSLAFLVFKSHKRSQMLMKDQCYLIVDKGQRIKY